MLNKIKDKFIHILREICGYYELREEFFENDDKWYDDFEKLEEKYNQLSSKHEAKILEYDILDNKYNEGARKFELLDNNYKNMIVEVTNGKISYFDDTSDFVQTLIKIEDIINNNYKKYLVAELEEILKIMKEKGIHPQDLIKRIINKANRDLKE